MIRATQVGTTDYYNIEESQLLESEAGTMEEVWVVIGNFNEKNIQDEINAINDNITNLNNRKVELENMQSEIILTQTAI